MKRKFKDLKKHCKDELRDALKILKQVLHEEYQEARNYIYRFKVLDENITLPEVGPASDEEITEVEKSPELYSEGRGQLQATVRIIRDVCRCMNEIQDFLDSFEQ